VRRFLPIIVIVLLAAWLPATLHCAMETAGVLERSDCCESRDDPVAATDEHCDADHCAVLEDGAPGAVSGMVVAPMPALPVITRLAPIRSASEATKLDPVTAAELDPGRLWRRTERVVPLARAP
jgi:hypothetical protein